MRTFLLTVLLGAFVHATFGDTVTLKTGEKIEGKIKKETDTDLTISVHISASVIDERTFRKDDIEKIEKEQPDEIAFQELQYLKPDPLSSFAPEVYDRIVTTLKHFRVEFPESKHLPEVQRLLDVFETEQARVAVGSVKYLGRWLAKSEADKRRVQIEAQQLLAALRQQAAGGDSIGALNTFDLFEKSYANTRSYPDAIEFVEQLLGQLAQQLAARARLIDFEKQQFQKQVAMTAEPQKSELLAAKKREDAGFAAAIAAAQRSRVKWPPMISRSSASVEGLQKMIPTELARLSQVPLGKIRQSIGNVDEAKVAIASKEAARAEALLKNALQLWPQNEAATYWLQRLTGTSPSPTPPPVAKAVQSQPAIRSTPAPARVIPQPTILIAEIASPTPSPSPTPSASPGPSPKPTITPTPKPAPREEASVEPQASPRPFLMTVPGGFTILALALVLVGVLELISRMQSKTEAPPEPEE